jgi:hypothetical protein
MKNLAKVISLVALVATVAVPCVFLAGRIELDSMKSALLAATVVWFVATPWWMD